jgi:peptidoglycan/xylan/chitin deacetylase (PgdA/CDA1 family)
MNSRGYITTSWDDGHPLDFRLADLLAQYQLNGTFYIPRQAPNETMSPTQIRQLSRQFEIAAHTMHHVFLNGATELVAEREITESKSWVEEVTGRPCSMFCPPGGKFDRRHLQFIREAGYTGLRSVELLSTDFPHRRDGLLIMPTTLQAHPHTRGTYLRNGLKRLSARNLWRYVTSGAPGDWVEHAQALLETVAHDGGVFHLWGHSWELQEAGQWQRLEEVMRFLSWFIGDAPARTNAEICSWALRSNASIEHR